MTLRKYIVKRMLEAVPLLFIISILSFIITYLSPGEVVSVFDDPLAHHASTYLRKKEIMERLGLDQPVYVQYFTWIKGVLLEGNLGHSFLDGQPVLQKIMERMPATLLLTGTAMLISLLISIPIGIYGAIRKNSFFDFLFTSYTYLGISFPVFYFGILTILVFSLTLGWLPASGMRDDYDSFNLIDRLLHLILPAAALSFGMIASKSRYLRNSMMEVIRQDYILTARSKGMSEKKVIVKHALRNALLPFITITTLQFPILLSGAFIIEQIFAWPGIGRLAINAIFMRDYPIVIGTTMITSVLVIFSNLLADILYALLDPRIQY